MSGQADLRASDRDREEAAEAIRVHYAEGRLDDEELNERLAAVYAARTAGELAALGADLPPLPVSVKEQRAELAARRRELQRRLLQQSGGGLALFAICTAIWAGDGGSGQFWPVWVLILVVVPLLRNGWRLYGPAPQLDRVEAELERRERQRDRHARRSDRRARRHGGG